MKKEVLTDELDINIDSISNIYSEFSTKTNCVINPELIQFIEQSNSSFSRRNNLKINFCLGESSTEEEKEACKKNLKNYYSNQVREANKLLNFYYLISFSLLLIGIVCITILNFIVKANAPYLIITFLEIICWVFTWESVDILCFKRGIKSIEIKKLEKILKSEINFK